MRTLSALLIHACAQYRLHLQLSPKCNRVAVSMHSAIHAVTIIICVEPVCVELNERQHHAEWRQLSSEEPIAVVGLQADSREHRNANIRRSEGH